MSNMLLKRVSQPYEVHYFKPQTVRSALLSANVRVLHPVQDCGFYLTEV